MSEAMPGEVEFFCRYLIRDVLGVLGEDLVGVYVHGSAVLGDFAPRVSDIDLLIIVRHGTSSVVIERAADALAAERECPGVGLEASIVAEPPAHDPRPPWPFLVHVATNPNDRKTVWCRPDSGDADLILHYAVIRQSGVALHGPSPALAVGEVARAEILRQMAAELRWAVQHSSEGYAVLNACRALRYRDEGVFASKTAGGTWAVRAGIQPELVERALRSRQREIPAQPSKHAIEFVLKTAQELIP